MKSRVAVSFLTLALVSIGSAHAQFMGPGQRGGQTRNVYVTNTNPNGQTTSANSSPVVLPSDQSNLPNNLKQVNGSTLSLGAALSAAAIPVVTPTDQAAAAALGQGATGSAAPSGAVQAGFVASGATGGRMRGSVMCDNHVFKHITSAADTLAVQGVASQSIYVCAWRSRAAGVATWFLENTASVNANCSSTLSQITGLATEAANTGETWGAPYWGGLKNTSGNGLCINSTGTGGVDIDVWYTQF